MDAEFVVASYCSPAFPHHSMTRLLAALFACLLIASCGNAQQAASDYKIALQYMNGEGVAKDEKKGMEFLTKAAEGGNADAQLMLGFYLIKGEGVTQDAAKGFAYFEAAAKQGNRDAQYNTGLAYVRAQGVKEDYKKALSWFEKAALQDDVGSQYNLGVMYVNGEGTVADPVTAYAWFKIANEKKYEGAEEGMGVAKNAMTSDQIADIDATVAAISKKIKKPAPQVQVNTAPAPSMPL